MKKTTNRFTRLLALAVALCLLLGAAPAIFAAEDGQDYGGEGFTAHLSPDGVLTISGTTMSYYYESAPWGGERELIKTVVIEDGIQNIGYYAFSGCRNLTSVSIPRSVTIIEGGAFEGCTSLASITIPNSVTSIGDYAFCRCDSLIGVSIPNSVTSIGDRAFSECTSMTNATISNSITSIGLGVFADCTSLANITIPNSVTSIGAAAFGACTSLTSITIPDSVTSIGAYAFSDCTGLTSISIPSSVTGIGEGAFEQCTSLTSIFIPASVTSIGAGAFARCSKFTLQVAEGNTKYCVIDGCLYNKEKTILLYAAVNGAETFHISEDVKAIGDRAFYWCENLKSVTIPGGVTNIGKGAFSQCASLSSITIPSSVTSIGESAFSYCSSLSCITIPANVTNIDGWAFYTCTNLTSVAIPNSVTTIGEAAFYNCTSLTQITVPGSVTKIGSGAFYGCDMLAEVCFLGSMPEVYEEFSYMPLVPEETVVYYPAGDKTWTDSSVEIRDKIGGIMQPYGGYKITEGAGSTWDANSDENLSFRADGALKDCIGVTVNGTLLEEYDYTLREGSTIVELYADYLRCLDPDTYTLRVLFTDGTAETTFTVKYVEPDYPDHPDNPSNPDGSYDYKGEGYTAHLSPDGVLTVSGTYMNNHGNPWRDQSNKIKSIVIKDGIKNIGAYAFAHCEQLTSVSIPSSVTTINYAAFAGCTSLKEISLPNSVTSIEPAAFQMCTGLTSVTLSNSLTTIGDWAFSGCTSLKEITIPDSVTSIGELAFAGCTALTSVKISEKLTTLEYGVFGACTSLTTITIPGSVTKIGEAAFYMCDKLNAVVFLGKKPEIAYNYPVEEYNEETGEFYIAYIPHAFSDSTILYYPAADKTWTDTDKAVREGIGGIWVARGNHKITDGAKASWDGKNAKNLSFRADGVTKDFVGLTVDGKAVDPANYKLKDGNAVVELTADFLKTLASGEHTLRVLFKDGTAETTFTVKAALVSPSTGDSFNPAWVVLLALSLGGLAVLIPERKKSLR